VTVRIPTTMRPLTGGEKQVSVETGTLSDVIAALEAAHPGLGERLLDDDGALRKFVNIFVDDDDVRYLDGLDTKVGDHSRRRRRLTPYDGRRRDSFGP
jgi:molybdopterin synthase sulfur carrier subunit